MLRLAVLSLLVANLAFFAWSRGLLLPLGMGPTSPSEPHRIEQQLRPEDIRIGAPAASRGNDGAVTARRQST